MPPEKVDRRLPSPQTAIDIFAGEWQSDLSAILGVENSGTGDFFFSDPRPKWAAKAFAKGLGRLDGMTVLEIGPLEGGHSYQMEQMGAAKIVAIDTSVDAYLKCLIIKELLQLKRCRFMLGDALSYMKATTDRYNLIFCSGILYHMPNPVELIKACCEVGNHCFVWTHYHDPESGSDSAPTPRAVTVAGYQTDYYLYEMPSSEDGELPDNPSEIPSAHGAWMNKDSILHCFRCFGLDEITMLEDIPDHPNGPAMSFVASRHLSLDFVTPIRPE